MNLQPLGDRVLVKPLKEETTTASGIVLTTGTDEKKKDQGEVMAIGSGEKVQKLNLEVGNKVVFGSYAGEEIEFENETYKVLEEKDILALIQ